MSRLDLDLSGLEARWLDPEKFLPAPGQGIIAIQIRSDDADIANSVSILNSPSDHDEACLERGLLAKFDSGCSLPLGVYSKIKGNELHLKATLGVREEGCWSKQLETDIIGTSINEVINNAYNELTTR